MAAPTANRTARKSMGSILLTASLMMKNVDPQIAVTTRSARVAVVDRRTLPP